MLHRHDSCRHYENRIFRNVGMNVLNYRDTTIRNGVQIPVKLHFVWWRLLRLFVWKFVRIFNYLLSFGKICGPVTISIFTWINLLKPNDLYSSRTAPLTSEVSYYIFIQQIMVLNILNMVHTLRFFPLQNAVCFIILTYFVPVLFTFYIFIQQI